MHLRLIWVITWPEYIYPEFCVSMWVEKKGRQNAGRCYEGTVEIQVKDDNVLNYVFYYSKVKVK